MLDWIARTISRLGYVGIALLTFLENVFPPLPSEVIMPLAGYTASVGRMDLLGVIVAGTLGSVLGALPLYYLGRRLGEERIKAWADRHGRWLALSGAEIDRARHWFDRHGGSAVFLCRLVPGVRSLISIPAGIDQMHPAPFLLYTTLGAGIWTALLTSAGYLLGANYRRVEEFLGPVSTAVLLLIAAVFLLWIARRRGHKRSICSAGAGRRRSPG